MARSESGWWFGVYVGVIAALPAVALLVVDWTMLDSVARLAESSSETAGTGSAASVGGGFSVGGYGGLFVGVDSAIVILVGLATIGLAVALFIDARHLERELGEWRFRPVTLGLAALVPGVGTLVGAVYLLLRRSEVGFVGLSDDGTIPVQAARRSSWWLWAVIAAAAFQGALLAYMLLPGGGPVYLTFKLVTAPVVLGSLAAVYPVPIYLDVRRLAAADIEWSPSADVWPAVALLGFFAAFPITVFHAVQRWRHVGL